MSTKIITGDDYRSSLHDGRQVYYDGSLVADLSAHPRFAAAVDVTAASYDHAMEQRDASDQPAQELEYPPTEADLRWQVHEFAGLEGSRDMTRLSTYSGLLGMQTTAGWRLTIPRTLTASASSCTSAGRRAGGACRRSRTRRPTGGRARASRRTRISTCA